LDTKKEVIEGQCGISNAPEVKWQTTVVNGRQRSISHNSQIKRRLEQLS